MESNSPPRSVGRYVLGRRLGAGGMGAVFSALQPGPVGLRRLVALKVMGTAVAADPEMQRLFLREAALAVRAEHPSIVRTYEAGDADGELFLAMELLWGGSLARMAKQGPLAPPVALRIAVDLCAALEAVHGTTDAMGRLLEVVHRDVSPQNIVVTYRGAVKLLDFGVARINAVDASHTKELRGKWRYAAPEQRAGGRMDARADIYAVALVVCELFTGAPVRADDVEPWNEDRERARAALMGRGVPAPVQTVLLRALAPRPEARFASALTLGRAFDQAALAAGVEVASEEELSREVLCRVPPEWTPDELEREIMGRMPGSGVLSLGADVHDLPTRTSELHEPAPAPGVADAKARSRVRRRRALALAIAFSSVAVVAVGLAVRWHPVPYRDVAAGTMGAGLAHVAQPVDRAEVPGLPASAPRDDNAVPSEDVGGTGAPRSSVPDAGRVTANGRPRPAVPPAEAPRPAVPPAEAPRPAVPPAEAPRPAEPGKRLADVTLALAPASNRGELVVWSSPWGRVEIDGAPAGDSPLRIEVGAGDHVVRVVSDAGVQERHVAVDAGAATRVRFQF